MEVILCDLCGNEIYQDNAYLVRLGMMIETRCFKCWKLAPKEAHFNHEEWEMGDG
ncbi:MAG: hypothetical protein ACYDBI_05865 [Thermoplasmataceae archaeon]